MTLRTTSATRRSVVSRSSDVASTSATSSSSDSAGRRSGLDTTEPIACMIAAAFRLLFAQLVRLNADQRKLLAPILAAQCKCLQDCDTFPRNRDRTRPQTHPEF